jgi:hypothetical protein
VPLFFLNEASEHVTIPQSPLRSQPAPAGAELPKRTPLRSNSPKTIYLVLGLLLILIAAGLACVPWLRSEKLRFSILRNQIELSTAPDEPVLVDDALLLRALQWKVSPSLKHQLVDARSIGLEQPAPPHGEFVLVLPEGDSLLATLHSQGYQLTPNASQAAFAAAGGGFHTPGKAVFRIYFAVRAVASPRPSQTEADTP